MKNTTRIAFDSTFMETGFLFNNTPGTQKAEVMFRVMIVDDEPLSLRRVVRLVKAANLGFQIVATAHDGQEALEKLSVEPVDVLFTDIRMPIMDGKQLVQKVHLLYPACQIVIISGAAFDNPLKDEEIHQPPEYLPKPVSARDIQALLLRMKQKFLCEE